MSIFLIRHAETTDNARRIIQTPSAALSAVGRDQARQLATRIGDTGAARILASDLARARETADCLGAITRIAVEAEPLLRERDFGELRGRAYAQLTTDPFAADYVPPKGESWPVFYERVAAAWVRICSIAALTPGNLAVITHGLVCRALVERHLRLAKGQQLPTKWENTAVTEIEAYPPWTIRQLNCISHLSGGRQSVRASSPQI